MNEQTFNWVTSDGLKIHAKDWHVQNPKAVIIMVHGLGEHCQRYAHLATFFNDQHFGFVGYDRRGHGHSEGKRGHTISFEAFLDEVETLFKKTKELYPNSPILIYGHSMGGNIALNYVIKRKPEIIGLILSGTWIVLHEKPPTLLIAFAKLINKIFPTFTQENGLDPKNISTDPDEVQKYINDPLVHSKITSNTGLEMIKAAEFLNTFDGKIDVPVLMMHGAEDKIVSPEGSRAFVKRVSGNITYKEWEGLFHEIHNEPNKAAIFDFVLNWINNLMNNNS